MSEAESTVGERMKARSSNRVTIRDVARHAGVSKSTVSRVLNDKGYASSDTVERVQRAIEELNYVPQATARGLASQRNGALGLLVNDLSTLTIPPLLSGIDSMIQEEDYNLLIAAAGHQASRSVPLGAHNTDGLLVYADSVTDEQLRRFYEAEFPVVLMHRHPPEGVDIPSVNIENRQSTRELISHLIEEHGYRRIAFLRGPDHQEDSREREESYVETLRAHDISVDPTLIELGGFSEVISRQAVEDWLSEGIEPDAIFAGDDGGAMGAIKAIRQAGLRVPEDIAVVGFDDDRYAEYGNPSLTTVHVPLEQVGREAVKRLMRLVREGAAESTVLPTSVVIRRSCGCQYPEMPG